MDLNATDSQPLTREFRAVVLSGFGNELIPLTSNYGVEACPKALIPAGNKPIIDYVLSWIENSGIKDVLFICPTAHKAAISHHIHSDLTAASSSLRIDVQIYDESMEMPGGTCALLRHFSNRITEDFVVLPCDFIPPPSLPLSSILNKFRTESITDGAMATTCWFASSQPDKNTIVEDWGSLPAPSPIVWDDSTGTLLHIDNPDDLDRNSEEIELRMSLLSQYGYLPMYSRFDINKEVPVIPGRAYRRNSKILMYMSADDLVKQEKYARILNPITNAPTQATALNHSSLHSSKELREKKGHYTPEELEPSSPDGSDGASDSSSLRVGVVIHQGPGYVTRVNTIHSLVEINRRLLSETTYSLPVDSKSRSLIDQKAQISSDSMLGDFTQVSERTNIKRSVIGKHCVIGKMAKIVGCVLFDHCVIEDGAKLDGCVLGKNTKVGAKAELTRVVTQAGYEVSPGESTKNEKLEVTDWTADVGDDDEESDEDDEEEEEEEEEED
ncbi:Translation initiation factor eIF-2B subunit gamma [Marasmius crinis-equi]|uniref:Translation initiation factor eIF2B subunit gamma n=1 Tax=Marasmius crinis-equi TaxID=585013 RepID=A0ABR3FXE7_9AGAR